MEAMAAAERANREAAEAERKARASVEASAAERSELLLQAKDLGTVGDGPGKKPLKDVLAAVQARTVSMARKIGRLESEIQPLAGENAALQSCRLLVEADRGEGHDLSRMRVEVSSAAGTVVEAGELAAGLKELNRGGAICPAGMRWDDLRAALVKRFGRR